MKFAPTRMQITPSFQCLSNNFPRMQCQRKTRWMQTNEGRVFSHSRQNWVNHRWSETYTQKKGPQGTGMHSLTRTKTPQMFMPDEVPWISFLRNSGKILNKKAVHFIAHLQYTFLKTDASQRTDTLWVLAGFNMSALIPCPWRSKFN